jgi:hypothetical protein
MPSASERQILRDNLQYHLDYFSGKKDDVKAFLSQGEAGADATLDERELAAYTSVGSLLLTWTRRSQKNDERRDKTAPHAAALLQCGQRRHRSGGIGVAAR